MQLLHGICCFDFVSDIPLPPSTMAQNVFSSWTSKKDKTDQWDVLPALFILLVLLMAAAKKPWNRWG